MRDEEPMIEVVIDREEDWPVYRLYEYEQAKPTMQKPVKIPLSFYNRFKRLNRQWSELQEELHKL